MIGQRIKTLRKKYGETQQQLGNFLGVSRQSVSSYESDKYEPDINLLKKISSRYNVSADYILGKTNIRNYKDKLNIDRITKPLNSDDPVLNSILETFISIIEDNQSSEKLLIFNDILKSISKLFQSNPPDNA